MPQATPSPRGLFFIATMPRRFRTLAKECGGMLLEESRQFVFTRTTWELFLSRCEKSRER